MPKQAVIAYAHSVGCPLKVAPWPGNGDAPTADDVRFMTHEIAHWLVATPHERTQPWMGMGPPPGNLGRNPPIKEGLAALLGVVIMCELDTPFEYIKQMAFDYNQDYNTEEHAANVKGLRRRKLWSTDRDRLARMLRTRFISGPDYRAWVREEADPSVESGMTHVGIEAIDKARSRAIDAMYGWAPV
jgi:hypothetical protein